MIKPIKTLLLIATLAILSACGWHFQQSVTMPNEWRTLALEVMTLIMILLLLCVANCRKIRLMSSI